METITLTPVGTADVQESTNYEIQKSMGADFWSPLIRNLSQQQARMLLDRLQASNSGQTTQYRAVLIKVMDW